MTRRFTQIGLPALIAVGTLVLYLITLNRSPSFLGLPFLARATGWDWRPVFDAPLTYLLTGPIRWLPAGWQLVGLNLVAAVCAALTLGLLARSVALLPQDRTRPQRENGGTSQGLPSLGLDWVPPLAAALVCGLQMTFWENAVVGTGEALNLLVFAYVLRCLLEYRQDRRLSWLYRLALVYGLGITNNAALIGFLPVLGVALVWILGLELFRFRVLAPMALLGLAGLSLYLLLPALNSGSEVSGSDFWTALRINLGQQKRYVFGFPRHLLLLTGLTSLLPLLLISIRWPDSHGDTSAVGSWATEVMLHVMHGAFLVLCVWVAFDPPFSPRELGRGVPFLTFYYLGALCIGYFCGYALLVFGERRGKSRRVETPAQRLLAGAIVGLVCLGVVVVPVLLLRQNIPKLARLNAPDLGRYARQMARQLPAGAMVLSDDTTRLYAVIAALSSQARQSLLLLDTTSLPLPAYHRYLAKTRPKEWTVPSLTPGQSAILPGTLLEMVAGLSATRQTYYLHPSYGYYFERLQARPQGLIYRLTAYATNSVEASPLTAAEIAANDAEWKQVEAESFSDLERRLHGLARGRDAAELFYGRDPLNFPLVWTAAAYSRALNYWGVRLQQQGLFEPAAGMFRKACEVNPSNPSAFVNLEFNQAFQKNHKALDRFSDQAMEKLSHYQGNIELLYGFNGPIDEPTFRGEVVGPLMVRAELFRQAQQEYLRALQINSNDFNLQLKLGGVWLQSGQAQRTLDLVRQIRTQSAESLRSSTNQAGLVQIEAWARFLLGDLPQAQKLLVEAEQRFPESDSVFATLARIYSSQAQQQREAGQTNEFLQTQAAILAVYERQIKAQPSNPNPLVNASAFYIGSGQHDRAISLLTRALALDPRSTSARINRGLALLRAGRLEEARLDYTELQREYPAMARVHYGLGEIAYLKADWREALRRYEDYLRNAPADTDEAKFVQGRVAELRRKVKGG